jgi:hypothetical protein
MVTATREDRTMEVSERDVLGPVDYVGARVGITVRPLTA